MGIIPIFRSHDNQTFFYIFFKLISYFPPRSFRTIHSVQSILMGDTLSIGHTENCNDELINSFFYWLTYRAKNRVPVSPHLNTFAEKATLYIKIGTIFGLIRIQMRKVL